MSGLEPVTYGHAGTALTGWLARPARASRGAVVIYPTIANANAHMERRARMLADAGFVAMIADFYGQPVRDFAHAGELATDLRADWSVYRARLLAGLDALCKAAPGLPLAVIGYCMGGQAALEVARSGADLRLAASFHGLLETRHPADRPIPARLLVCHGDADPMVPRSHVAAFQTEMDAVAASWHLHAYSGVQHGFTDPESDARGLPAIAYDASADRQSWIALTGLLDETMA